MRRGKLTAKRLLAAALVLLLCAALLPMSVLAEDLTATTMRLEEVVGTVTLRSKSGQVKSYDKDKLPLRIYSGETVETGPASYAALSLDGSKAFKLDADSKARICSVRSGGVDKLEVQLISGKTFGDVTEHVGSGQQLAVTTGNSICGVVGTVFSAEVVSPLVTVLRVFRGAMDFTVQDVVSGDIVTDRITSGQAALGFTIPEGSKTTGSESTGSESTGATGAGGSGTGGSGTVDSDLNAQIVIIDMTNGDVVGNSGGDVNVKELIASGGSSGFGEQASDGTKSGKDGVAEGDVLKGTDGFDQVNLFDSSIGGTFQEDLGGAFRGTSLESAREQLKADERSDQQRGQEQSGWADEILKSIVGEEKFSELVGESNSAVTDGAGATDPFSDAPGSGSPTAGAISAWETVNGEDGSGVDGSTGTGTVDNGSESGSVVPVPDPGPEPIAASYTVTFDANGGTGTMQSMVVTRSTVVPVCGFKREGYRFTGWKDQNGKDWKVGSTLTAPGAGTVFDMTLYAQWEKAEESKYNIVVKALGHGSATVNPVVAAKDEMVEVCIYGDVKDGVAYEVESVNAVTVNGSVGKRIEDFGFSNDDGRYIGRITFDMPAEDVYIEASFKPKYAVTCEDSNYYTASATPRPYVAEGETVTVSLTPAEGYEISGLLFKSGDSAVDVPYTAVSGGYSFTMPAYPVTVTAILPEKAGTFLLAASDLGNDYGLTATLSKGAQTLSVLKPDASGEVGEDFIVEPGDELTVSVTNLPSDWSWALNGVLWTADEPSVTYTAEIGGEGNTRTVKVPTLQENQKIKSFAILVDVGYPVTLSVTGATEAVSIAFAGDESGAMKKSFWADSTVSFTVSTPETYTATVTAEDVTLSGPEATDGGSVYSFTMPGFPVTVTVAVAEIQQPPEAVAVTTLRWGYTDGSIVVNSVVTGESTQTVTVNDLAVSYTETTGKWTITAADAETKPLDFSGITHGGEGSTFISQGVLGAVTGFTAGSESLSFAFTPYLGLRFEVSDASGALSGASVTLTPPTGMAAPDPATTNDSGVAVFTGSGYLAGEYSYTVTMDGYTQATDTVTLADGDKGDYKTVTVKMTEETTSSAYTISLVEALQNGTVTAKDAEGNTITSAEAGDTVTFVCVGGAGEETPYVLAALSVDVTNDTVDAPELTLTGRCYTEDAEGGTITEITMEMPASNVEYSANFAPSEAVNLVVTTPESASPTETTVTASFLCCSDTWTESVIEPAFSRASGDAFWAASFPAVPGETFEMTLSCTAGDEELSVTSFEWDKYPDVQYSEEGTTVEAGTFTVAFGAAAPTATIAEHDENASVFFWMDGEIAEGETTITPEDGVFSVWTCVEEDYRAVLTVTDGEGETLTPNSQYPDDWGNQIFTYTMGSSSVTVTAAVAELAAADTKYINFSDSKTPDGGKVMINGQQLTGSNAIALTVGSAFRISIQPDEGYSVNTPLLRRAGDTFVVVSLTKLEDGEWYAVMPETDVLLTASFNLDGAQTIMTPTAFANGMVFVKSDGKTVSGKEVSGGIEYAVLPGAAVTLEFKGYAAGYGLAKSTVREAETGEALELTYSWSVSADSRLVCATGFIMPETNLTMSYDEVTFQQDFRAITVEPAENGAVWISDINGLPLKVPGSGEQQTAYARSGQTVTLAAEPDTNFALDALSYMEAGSAAAVTITATDGVYSFTMPAKAVTLHATFTGGTTTEYTVTGCSFTGVGSVRTYDGLTSTQQAGATVTLVVDLASGYQLKSGTLKVTYGDNQTITPTQSATNSTQYTFTMPAADVTVTAEVEQTGVAAPTITQSDGANGAYNVTISTATQGAYLRYTTDGTTPNVTTGTVYEGSTLTLTGLNAGTPIKAFAYTGEGSSIVKSPDASYVIMTGNEVSVKTLRMRYRNADGLTLVGVTGADDSSIDPANFSLTYDASTDRYTVTSATDTVYTFNGSNGGCVVNTNDSSVTTISPHASANLRSFSLQIKPMYSIRFFVQDTSGKSLAGALVTLTYPDGTTQETKTTSDTQSVIFFESAEYVPGTYTYTASKDGYPTASGTITLTADDIAVTQPYFAVLGETHTVTVADGITGGTVTANMTQAASGQQVVLTVTPDSGCEIGTVQVTQAGGSTQTLTPQSGVFPYYFYMNNVDVTVTATFVEQTPEVVSSATYFVTDAEPEEADALRRYQVITMTGTPKLTTVLADPGIGMETGVVTAGLDASGVIRSWEHPTGGTCSIMNDTNVTVRYDETTGTLTVGEDSFPTDDNTKVYVYDYNGNGKFQAEVPLTKLYGNRAGVIGALSVTETSSTLAAVYISRLEFARYLNFEIGPNGSAVSAKVNGADANLNGSTTVYSGDTVTMRFAPDNGYAIYSVIALNYRLQEAIPITVSHVGGEDEYSFTVPANTDVVVQADFCSETAYTLTLAPGDGGTLEAFLRDQTTGLYTVSVQSGDSVRGGVPVTVKVTTTGTNVLDALTCQPAGAAATAIGYNNGSYVLTMPEADATVAATYLTGYAVTIDQSANGTAVMMVNGTTSAAAAAGDTIIVTLTPADGYQFAGLRCFKTGDDTVAVTTQRAGTDQFTITMPAYPITITPDFAAANAITTSASDYAAPQYITVDPAGIQFYGETIPDAAAGNGSTVVIGYSGKTVNGVLYLVDSITVTDANSAVVPAAAESNRGYYNNTANTSFRFMMPETAVTVTAHYAPAHLISLTMLVPEYANVGAAFYPAGQSEPLGLGFARSGGKVWTDLPIPAAEGETLYLVPSVTNGTFEIVTPPTTAHLEDGEWVPDPDGTLPFDGATGRYTVTVGTADVNLYAAYAEWQATTYSVTLPSVTNGTITLLKQNAQGYYDSVSAEDTFSEGDILSVRFGGEENYAPTQLGAAYGASQTSMELSIARNVDLSTGTYGASFQLTIPAGDVTISGSFAQAYPIQSGVGNGVCTVSGLFGNYGALVGYAFAGETVQVSIEPDEGCTLAGDSVRITYRTDPDEPTSATTVTDFTMVSDGVYRFTMPAAAVSVLASCTQPVSNATLTIPAYEHGTVTVSMNNQTVFPEEQTTESSVYSIPDGAEVRLTLEGEDQYALPPYYGTVELNGETISAGSYTFVSGDHYRSEHTFTMDGSATANIAFTNGYAVHFRPGNSGSGTRDDIPVPVATLSASGAVTLPECDFTYNVSNRKFRAWTETPYEEGAMYAPGEQAEIMCDTTFTALWADYAIVLNEIAAETGTAAFDGPTVCAANAGNEIRLHVTPAEGYQFEKLLIQPFNSNTGASTQKVTEIVDGIVSFLMPRANVKLTVTFTQSETHQISYSAGDFNGTLSVFRYDEANGTYFDTPVSNLAEASFAKGENVRIRLSDMTTNPSESVSALQTLSLSAYDNEVYQTINVKLDDCTRQLEIDGGNGFTTLITTVELRMPGYDVSLYPAAMLPVSMTVTTPEYGTCTIQDAYGNNLVNTGRQLYAASGERIRLTFTGTDNDYILDSINSNMPSGLNEVWTEDGEMRCEMLVNDNCAAMEAAFRAKSEYSMIRIVSGANGAIWSGDRPSEIPEVQYVFLETPSSMIRLRVLAAPGYKLRAATGAVQLTMGDGTTQNANRDNTTSSDGSLLYYIYPQAAGTITAQFVWDEP